MIFIIIYSYYKKKFSNFKILIELISLEKQKQANIIYLFQLLFYFYFLNSSIPAFFAIHVVVLIMNC